MSEVIEIHECFLCGDTTNNVLYCSMCNHYFCDGCRKKYGTRIMAAVEEKLTAIKRFLVW
jgi:hypothetical protein